MPKLTRALDPSAGLLAKLGSIVVHVEEAMGPGGHEFDAVTIKALLGDQEVQTWLADMRAIALLPVKRGAAR